MVLDNKLDNYLLPIGGLLVLGGLIISTALGPVVSPPEGIPCLDRHVMCAPETNHSPDAHEEDAPQLPLRGFVATRTATPVTIELPDLVRKPEEAAN